MKAVGVNLMAGIYFCDVSSVCVRCLPVRFYFGQSFPESAVWGCEQIKPHLGSGAAIWLEACPTDAHLEQVS
ncbi:hypothetical protein TNCV_2327311 [Trichonephila clavipes]|nr:hypothetical protein TNCV_2327311 [Trichonephila clavipes]